jgi:two-component system, chemotaxis family, chemotaxis protein CheV
MENENQGILLESGTNELEIVEFGIKSNNGDKSNGRGLESFGINVAKVREIINLPTITAIPTSHPNIKGVFNLRNRVIPLVDLAEWLQLESDGKDSKKNKVIVTQFNNAFFGFLVGNVNRIYRVSWEEVEPPTENVFCSMNENCITGLIKMSDRIILMLDFEKIVADINPNLGIHLEGLQNKEEDQEEITVLIAEDSQVLRTLLTETLGPVGFKVIMTNNGKDAWDKLEDVFLPLAQDGNTPINDIIQLVITDIEMPQMDGHHLIKKIKEHPELKTLPIIVFSSLINEEIKRKGKSVGADIQIAKPEIGRLAAVAHELLKK